MLTPEQRAEGWIEWHGGECPVPLDSRPGIIVRYGAVAEPGGHCTAEHFDWRHGEFPPSTDIIAYKPEVPND